MGHHFAVECRCSKTCASATKSFRCNKISAGLRFQSEDRVTGWGSERSAPRPVFAVSAVNAKCPKSGERSQCSHWWSGSGSVTHGPPMRTHNGHDGRSDRKGWADWGVWGKSWPSRQGDSLPGCRTALRIPSAAYTSGRLKGAAWNSIVSERSERIRGRFGRGAVAGRCGEKRADMRDSK